jgi:LysM repeat protein
MKRFTLLAFSAIMLASSSLAQKGDLTAKSSDKGLYLEHKVVPKESFYALGRIYNVSAKFLAAYNKLDLNKGLQIDQKLRIPLTDTNFTQTGNSGAPVYYKTGDKEGLMTVSKKNNNVKLAKLREWNNLANDEIKEDKKLIVGFLTGSGFKSVSIANKPSATELPPPVEQKDVVDEKPVIVKEPDTQINQRNVEYKKDVPVPKVIEEATATKPVEKPVVKKDDKPAPQGNGYFKTDFEKQIKLTPITKNEMVTSGIFKTVSGWQDAKYYLMIDKAAPGTIIKVINPSNNKAVYAKVLGEMAGIRQNIGLNIRISNAAAAALEIKEDDKFILQVSY